jgi:L-lysine exporter family protein LysE/ArgO
VSDILAFSEGFLFSLSLCFDLGMVNVALMKTGMERGFKPSFMLGFGSCFGDLFYLSLALLGVSFIFELEAVRWTLWIVGSAVLLYLTYKMLRESWTPTPLQSDGTSPVQQSSIRGFLTGAGLALSSPTVIVWFAFVAGPIVAGLNLTSGALAMFIAGFFTAGLAWSFGIALASSRFSTIAGPRIVRGLSFASAVLFFYFAMKVFLGGLQALV